jgi:uncharacterized protein YjbI with pentapeptide repeats
MPVTSNATADLSTSSVTVSPSVMSDNLDQPIPQPPSSSIPSSIEELFSRIASDAQSAGQNSTQPESFPSCSLEELFGIDTNVVSASSGVPDPVRSNEPSDPLLLEKSLEVQSHTQPVASSDDERSGSELTNDASNVRTAEMMLEDSPNGETKGSPEIAPDGEAAIAPSDSLPERDLNPPSIDLSLDGEDRANRVPYEPLEPDDTLLNRASQGDLEAFRQLLNEELAPHQATIVDIESRQDLLQISLSGERVPVQRTIEPLIKSWVLNVGFVKVQKIELYGQRDGSELPYWRSEFNPSELEYIIQPEELGFEFMEVPAEDFSFLKFDGVETPSEVNEEVNSEPLNLDSQDSTPNTLADLSVSDGGMDAPLDAMDDSPMLSPVEFLPASTGEDVAVEQSLSSGALETSAVENADSMKRRQLVDNFVAQYAAGERAFVKIDLSETDLSGINLTLADLQEAVLIWANLQDASLYHVNLSGAKLRHANLKGAKLRSANLQGADFLNADLSDADLSWSNLRGANLTGANLSEANLQNAILENVIMPDGTLLD